MKTGALLTAACRMGCVAAGGSEAQLSALTTYGRHLGLAFQIVDDLLDLTSTPEQLGKATQKDSKKGKNTYPNLMGIEEARCQAEEELAGAIAALASFGDRADRLAEIAEFVVRRTK